MNSVSLRPILAPIIGAAICFAATRSGTALKDPTIAQFVGTAVSVSDTKDEGPVEIRITRWSTDEELQDLRTALNESGPNLTLPVFRKTRPEAGIIMMPGIQGLGERVRLRWALTFQFARQIDTPSGRQIVIATDHHLKFGEPPVRRLTYNETGGQVVAVSSDGTAVTNDSTAPPVEFTLLDIRFGPDGKGVGKMAPASKVAYNAAKKIFEIENYTAQPLRLSALEVTRPEPRLSASK